MFGLDNLPYGVFDDRVGVRYGDQVLDLAAALDEDVFRAPSLNPFLALGRPAWQETRRRIQALLRAGTAHLIPLAEVELRLPFEVADYVDFYCSLEHASNLGRLFRPGEEPLKPNWRHLPVGYHGRAGTVVVSGTPVRRPYGQLGEGRFGPTEKLDIEAELGFVVGVGTAPGEQPGAFEDHVFGVTLVNDWSARDIQSWEYVPLGPFLGKSFATSVSPWVTPLEALEHCRVPGRAQEPEPLGYLKRTADWGLDLRLRVELNGRTVSEPPYRGMYWTPDQMLAHLTVNGATLRTGDLFASGTVSGPEDPGSFIELGRPFLADGDTVTISALTSGGMSLGEVSGTVT
ncbi:putative fumarylacetoacetase [Acrocarpospora phusangensis]|uniref:fumarylacetoacetase n=1 Tax=Acrocarpospora phusangensis TaxID=1070424 RepID=A0A919UTE5_9ACTN|nr:fumarylacetoacetate hydrolase family protein [Acrocarpospora phusangensis]GIH29673.1 putative fumarylacetoacetase [Acrocarpospora phusangensis]